MREFSGADFLRVLVTLVTLGAIIWWVGPRELVAAFSGVIWIWVIIRIVPYLASLWIQAWRWKLFLHLEGIVTDTNRLFRRIWMSRFFAHMLPGSVGGDIFRIVESGDYSGNRVGVARSVILDRVVALASLILYTSIACLVWVAYRNWSALGFIAALGVAGSSLGLWLLATEFPRYAARWFAEKLPEGRFGNFVSQLADSLSDLAGRPFLLLAAALATIAFNVTWAIGSYCGFLAFDLTISPLLVIMIMPVVLAVTALPVSVNGLGVSEGVFVLVFVALGLQPAEAAAVAILLRVTGLLMSALGGLLYLVERRRIATPP